MINLFSFAPQDASLSYLTQIFGNMNGILIDPMNKSTGGTVTILGSMFSYFNSVILTIGILIVIYTTVVGIMKTAHEGEFMGKNWNNLWIPIRMVLGIGALIPTGSGYSLLQIIMMWAIVQGIGAADTLWSTALGFTNIFGSPFAQANIAGVGSTSGLNGLFKSMVCTATSEITEKDPTKTDGGGYYCSKGKCSNEGATFPSGGCGKGKSTCTWSIGPLKTGGGCGELSYCNVDKACSGKSGMECAVCQGQVNALSTIVPTMYAVAKEFAQADYTYRDFYANSGTGEGGGNWGWISDYCSKNGISPQQCCVGGKSPLYKKDKDKDENDGGSGKNKDDGGDDSGSNKASQCSGSFPPPDGNSPSDANNEVVKDYILPYAMSRTTGGSNFMNAIVGQYNAQISAAIASAGSLEDKNLSGELQTAMERGWIMAGAYYYTLAGMNGSAQKAKNPKISMSYSDVTSGTLAKYRNNFSAASALISASKQSGSDSDSSSEDSESGFSTDWSTLGGGDELGEIATVGSESAQGLSDAFEGMIDQGNTDPLANIQAAGWAILIIVEILYPVFLALTIVLAFFANVNGWFLGTGLYNPMSGTMAMMYYVLLPAIFGLFGIMIGLGGMLGVYVPLIPYVIFTMGAIGWMLATIETMVAGPLVALGILSPSGQHEIMGKAEPALMLLFNVFLRPSLMIFGLLAAMKLAGIVVSMVNTMFWTVISGIGTFSILGLIFFLAAYVFLIVAIINKCMAAIYLIPERVMTWISGQAVSYGEAEGMAEVKRGGESAIAATQGAASAGEGKVKEAGRAYQKSRKPKKSATLTGDDGGGEEEKKK